MQLSHRALPLHRLERKIGAEKMREIKVEQHLIKGVKKRGGTCKKWVSPGNNGVPDRIAIFPGGIVFLIETKAPTGRMRQTQNVQKRDLESRDIHVYTLYTIEQVDEFLTMYDMIEIERKMNL